METVTRKMKRKASAVQHGLVGVCLMGSCLAALCLATPTAQAQTYSRTETITYHDNLSKWVVGQEASRTCTASTPIHGACDGETDSVVSQATYDPTYAIPQQTRSFGKLQQSLTYDTASAVSTGQRGTLKTVSDGRDSGAFTTTITLGSWYRGVPRSIQYPATPDQPGGASQSAVVNADGTIASVTDENGFATGYGYDAMGRLSLIDYPDGDNVDWTSTARTFSYGFNGDYGLPNHWRLWERTGNGYKVTHYDALLRPVVEDVYDSGNVSNTRSIVVKRYDAAGRLIFQSYPVRTPPTSWASTGLKGTHTTYDSLDRVLTVKQDWEGAGQLTTTTVYQAGFKTQVTNPRGFTTTTSYQTFDEPSFDAPVMITHPAGAFTHITRDPFGKPTKLRRSNSSSATGGTGIDRIYSYDPVGQELCRTKEPETGDAFMGYDAAGNLIWSAAGYNSSGTACATSVAVAARRVDRSYDARNRLLSLSFPNGQGDQVWSYTPDSLPATITTYNQTGQTIPVVNEYAYNKRRLLTGETSTQPSWYTWGIGYGYNSNGHLTSHTYPSGHAVAYAPNALGQATQAGAYASNVSYHPNGAVAQFTYGNGIVHTMTQNVRQLPGVSTDAYGATKFLSDTYDYDQNGNVEGITDGATGQSQRGNRDMAYDNLDRLTSTTSQMFGTATFTYDVFDNLMYQSITAGSKPRTFHYCYNTKWQLEFVRTGTICTGSTPSAPILGLEYDLQGNLSSRAVAAQSSQNREFVFDFGNRMRSNSGAGASGYRYDGHGRRVLAWDAQQGNILSMYGQGGQLFYDENHRAARTYNEYIYLAGSLVAERERNIDTAAVLLKYQHTDALGSPSVITNASRGVLERREYEPYGLQTTPVPQDGPGYTGHVFDQSTGLNYMQQRYYDPSIGRFLSVDPVTAYSNPIGAFNRYWYANNNPYRFTDPDGRQIAIPWEAIGEIAAKRGAQAGVASQVDSPAPGPGDVVAAGILIYTVGEIGYKIYQANQNESPDPDFTDTEGNKPPFTGEPGSTVRGGTGSRTYGDDGYPKTDRDTPHPDEKGTGNQDHVHDWGRPEGGGPPTSKDRGPSRDPQPGDPPQPRGPNVPPPDEKLR